MSWCRAVVRKRNQLGEKPGKEKRPAGRGWAGIRSSNWGKERKGWEGKTRVRE